MNDLIDRKALINDMRMIETDHPFDDKEDILETALATVDMQPPVEVVPVVHGEWVNEYINRYGHPCHCCSVCGFKASYQDKNFCPNCGAIMRQKA